MRPSSLLSWTFDISLFFFFFTPHPTSNLFYTLDNVVVFLNYKSEPTLYCPLSTLKPLLTLLDLRMNSSLLHIAFRTLPYLSRLVTLPHTCQPLLPMSSLHLHAVVLDIPCIPFFVLARDFCLYEVFPDSFSSRIWPLSQVHPYYL